ncbi:hypothetical protein CR513_56976, partial [Mucuna pruriens]
MVNDSVLNEDMRRNAQGSSSQCEILENKDKLGNSKEKDHGDDDRVTTATCDDLVILRDFESVNLVFDESTWIIDSGATLHNNHVKIAISISLTVGSGWKFDNSSNLDLEYDIQVCDILLLLDS